ncbi:hypothetical protein FB565_008865 [Actinoplanes lutulentus]|uniref:hypothetical protein n=1 Tax=Actinoplanes lutulentus TaxID=1287878 RepID=UPI000DB93CDB|nr:hypothetical protein [Actinoplanes lutulentus]MBB2949060.1 hypothetical protein [Actinoplanes lutulentus]
MTLVIGAAVLVAHLLLLHRSRRHPAGSLLTLTASVAVCMCTALLLTGHQAQRMRTPKQESLPAGDRAVAVSYERRTTR